MTSPPRIKGLGRIEDAVAVLRSDFVRQPSVPTYRVLLDFAAGVDRADAERIWAMDHAQQLASDPYAQGAVLVQLLLSEGDVDAAWEAADRYGPGWAWRELADRGAKARPGDAADLTGRTSKLTSGIPTRSSIHALRRHWRRCRNSMNAAVALTISPRSSRRSARTTVGGRR